MSSAPFHARVTQGYQPWSVKSQVTMQHHEAVPVEEGRLSVRRSNNDEYSSQIPSRLEVGLVRLHHHGIRWLYGQLASWMGVVGGELVR